MTKRTPSFYLTIKHKVFRSKNKEADDYRGNAGFIDPLGDRKYIIWINTNSSLLDRIGTLFHEFGHFLFYTIFKETIIDEKKEHIFCKKIDNASKEAFQEYIEE